MSNIKNLLKKALKDTVIISVPQENIRKCLDKYLESNFKIKDVEYRVEKISDENDCITITFNNEDIEDKMCDEVDIIENAILTELGKTQDDGTVRAFCSDPCSSKRY